MNFAQKQKKVGNSNLVLNTAVIPAEATKPTPEVAPVTPATNEETAAPDSQTKKMHESVVFVNNEIKKEYVYYTIKPGDTLWTIAQKYPGVTSTELMRLNNMGKSHTLKPGQKIKIKPKA